MIAMQRTGLKSRFAVKTRLGPESERLKHASQVCSICLHASREAIDSALAAHTPYRALAATFHVSLGALSRHSRHANGRAATVQGSNDVDAAIAELQRLLKRARRKKDARLALQAAKELRSWIALRAKLTNKPVPDDEPLLDEAQLGDMADAARKKVN